MFIHNFIANIGTSMIYQVIQTNILLQCTEHDAVSRENGLGTAQSPKGGSRGSELEAERTALRSIPMLSLSLFFPWYLEVSFSNITESHPLQYHLSAEYFGIQ